MKRKLVFMTLILILLLLTLRGALADFVQLNDTSLHLEADFIVENNDTDRGGTLMRWDLNNGAINLSANARVTDAKLCLYVVATNGTLDNDVTVCQIYVDNLNETSVGSNAGLGCDSGYNNSINTTISNITVENWGCMNVTHIVRAWNGVSDLGIRFEDPDNPVKDNDSNAVYWDSLTLTIGFTNGTSYVDFEDRENTNGTGNTPYLNITYTINTPPSFTAFKLESNDGLLNRTNCTLSLNYNCTDIDADDCDSVVEYSWSKNGAVIGGQTNRTLTGDNFIVGDVITGGIKIYDNSSANNNYVNDSISTTIRNSPPVATVLSFTNITAPTINGTFQWNISYYDEDGHSGLTPAILYSVATNASNNVIAGTFDGMTNGTSKTATITLIATLRGTLGHTKGDYIYLRNVYAYDNRDYGSKVNSSSINFTNCAISLKNVTLDGVFDNEPLICYYVADDVDNDLSTVNYTWYLNGALVADLKTQIVPESRTTVNQTWKCGVNISDGETYDYLESTTIAIAYTASSGGGGGTPTTPTTTTTLPPTGIGGGGLLPSFSWTSPQFLPENATFYIQPYGRADIFARPDRTSEHKITVSSTSSTGSSVNMVVVDYCGIYDGYEVNVVENDGWARIEPYKDIVYTLKFNYPEDYSKQECEVVVTFVNPSGESMFVRMVVHNDFVSNLIIQTINVFLYPVVFDANAQAVEFMTENYFLRVPSAVSFVVPAFGAVLLLFSYLMFRYILYRYVTELRAKNARFLLFVISFVLTLLVGVLLSYPIGVQFVTTSVLFGGVFAVVVVLLAVVSFRLPRAR